MRINSINALWHLPRSNPVNFNLMAHKSHKIALRTNNTYEQWLRSQCGYARFAYNNALSDFKNGLEVDTFRSKIDLNNRWNKPKKVYE